MAGNTGQILLAIRQIALYGRRSQSQKGINKLRKAQSSLEYTLVVAIFAAALISMSVYIKRDFQGNYRQTADEIGSAYEPKNTNSNTTFSSNSNSMTDTTTWSVDGKYKTTVTYITEDNTSRQGWEDVGPLP